MDGSNCGVALRGLWELNSRSPGARSRASSPGEAPAGADCTIVSFVFVAYSLPLTSCACFRHSSPVAESPSNDEIRQVVGIELSEQDAEALRGWYASFARGVAAFPAADLKRVEPPLRSVPGPVGR